MSASKCEIWGLSFSPLKYMKFANKKREIEIKNVKAKRTFSTVLNDSFYVHKLLISVEYMNNEQILISIYNQKGFIEMDAP